MPKPMLNQHISVAQLGARMHYAVPRIFSRAEMLDVLYSDFFASERWIQCFNILPSYIIPRAIRRVRSRTPKDIPQEQIRSFNWLGLRYAWLRSTCKSDEQRTQTDIRMGNTFSHRIMQVTKCNPQSMYVFDIASLELMRAWNKEGTRFVMEQTNAPRSISLEILRSENRRHPGWSQSLISENTVNLIMDRYEEAWSLADTIVAGSDFVRHSMKQCNAPHQKCQVVPYGVDLPMLTASKRYQEQLMNDRLQRRRCGKRLHVLTVGTVCLRKGAPYIMQAAKQLQGKAEFKLAGNINLTNEARQQMMQHTSLLGLIPRQEIQALYEWADVFLLPSVCEGSATVTYEALAYGLPVICTPNTGSVVLDRHDGMLVSTFSSEAVVCALHELIDDIDLWEVLSNNAFRKSQYMTVASYGKRLIEAIFSIDSGK